MTAPVTQQASEKIAMTAPVTQQGDGQTWRVRFVMPAKYTTDTLPKPNNAAVKIKEIAAKRFAVIRFSGWAADESLKRRTEDWTHSSNRRISSLCLHPPMPTTTHHGRFRFSAATRS
jgi:hypothetical protein